MGSIKEVVIIGGSFAGILAAKVIFSKNENSVRVTLISTSEKAYYNVSAPRLIIEPTKISKVLFPVAETLEKYSGNIDYTFIHGQVEEADLDNASLVVKTSEGSKKIGYDYLIIASGARTGDPAFKLNGDYNETVKALQRLNESTKSAQRIAILGGGATGVEIAGELGFNYGKGKEIVLYTGANGPLSFLGEKKSIIAVEKLNDVNVKVVNSLLSLSITKSSNNKTKIVFDNDTSEEFDVVIPSYGLKPNSEFLDKKVLDSKGFLKTDEFFRVEGYNNVFGLGDILSIGSHTVFDIAFNQKGSFENIVDYEILGKRDTKIKPYSGNSNTIVIPISKNGGIGILYGWNVPNFLVRFIKAKDFFISKAGEYLS